MSKFKVGDKVFHVGYGVGTVTDVDWADGCPVTAAFSNDVIYYFLDDGRGSRTHAIPQLYTLAEARKMCFDVPKEKKSKTLWLYYNIASRNFITTVEREPNQVGYLEKEITFEWEEEQK